ncbi:MAG: DUF308 domain-containing protein [Eggerthellaceae bacterium]|nr:DUF308 domain-containing protein [Eggerthellaceae bacterium]
MKAITIVMGAMMLVGGVYCMFAPIETYSALSWLIGAAMIVEGVGSALSWSERRRFGLADGWTLIGAIVSIALGVFLLGSYAAQYAVDLFIAYIIAIWLVIGGITRIAAAIGIRNYQNQMGAGPTAVNWVALLGLGVLIVILGVLCIFNPTSVMASVGFLLGLAIVFVGAGLVVRGVRM